MEGAPGAYRCPSHWSCFEFQSEPLEFSPPLVSRLCRELGLAGCGSRNPPRARGGDPQILPADQESPPRVPRCVLAARGEGRSLLRRKPPCSALNLTSPNVQRPGLCSGNEAASPCLAPTKASLTLTASAGSSVLLRRAPAVAFAGRPQRRPFSQLPLLALRAAAFKALLVAEGTFSSKALGDGNVPWRSSQLCLGERLLKEGFEGFLSLPEARCRFVFTASFVWLAGFLSFFF